MGLGSFITDHFLLVEEEKLYSDVAIGRSSHTQKRILLYVRTIYTRRRLVGLNDHSMEDEKIWCCCSQARTNVVGIYIQNIQPIINSFLSTVSHHSTRPTFIILYYNKRRTNTALKGKSAYCVVCGPACIEMRHRMMTCFHQLQLICVRTSFFVMCVCYFWLLSQMRTAWTALFLSTTINAAALQ